MTKKVLVAMSGGVDSSVALGLLKEQGYECYGATMQLYRNEEIGLPEGAPDSCGVNSGRSCCSWAEEASCEAAIRTVACTMWLARLIWEGSAPCFII